MPSVTAAPLATPVRERVLDWASIFAGAIIATALGIVLLAFGAALGLTVTSPYEGEGLSPAAFAIAAGLYFLWVQLLCFYIGGYVTGRMRPRAPELGEHETDVRDGLHGLTMWALGVIAAGVVTLAGVGGIGAVNDASPRPLAASIGAVVDRQVATQAGAEAAQGEHAAGSATEHRADVARKLAVISAFITAASLLVGGVAAFFGAHSGGHHRDRNVTWKLFESRARVGMTPPQPPPSV